MKKIEKEFLKDFQKENISSFDDVKNKIDFKKEKKSIFSFKNIFITSLIAVSMIAIIVPISVYFLTQVKVVSINIANKEDLLLEYEKNATFISDGIIIEKNLSNGEKTKAESSEYVIDSSSFNNNIPGQYPINIYLKDNPDVKTSFTVDVINLTIEDIVLVDYRKTYYLDEDLTNHKDIILEKVLSDGKNKAAKSCEYSVDYSNVNTSKFGTYPVYVELNSNSDFNLSFQVEVVELEQLSLKGEYYVDNIFANQTYPPRTYAFSVDENNIATNIYSELLLNGQLSASIIDGDIVISDNRHTQKMIYDPFFKSFHVEGMILGDPSFDLYLIDDNDYYITINDKNDETYIAVDGYLNSNTYHYLYALYVEVYLDINKMYPLTEDTKFNKDTTLYVGIKTPIDVSDIVDGVYYDENKEVKVRIFDNKIYLSTLTNGSLYDAYYDNDGNINLIGITSFEKYKYLIDEEALVVVSSFGEAVPYEIRYQKMNDKQAFIKIEDDNSRFYYVVNKGETLKPYFILRNEVLRFDFIGYDNTLPVVSDMTIKANIYHFYLSDLYGNFGTIDDYLNLTGSWEADRPTIDYQETRYLEHYLNYERVDVGFASFVDYDIDNNYYIIKVEFENAGTKYIKCNGAYMIYDEKMYQENNRFFEGFDFVGEYISSNNLPAYVRLDGYIGFYKKVTETASSITYHRLFPYSIDDTSHTYSFYYLEQTPDYDKIIHCITFTLNDEGKYTFDYNDLTYVMI